MEVLLEDARSGEAVGWDAELNVPTNAHNSVLLEPARYEARNGSGAAAVAAASLPRSGGRQMYRLVDAATSQQLYLRGWVVRAAPLSQPDDPSQRFYLLPVPRRRGGSRGAQGGGRRRAGEGGGGREDGRRLAEGKGGARLTERRRSGGGGGARRGDKQAKHGSGKRQQRQRKAGARHGTGDAGKGRGRRSKAGEQAGRIGGGRAQGGSGSGGGGGSSGGARAFWLVDVATGRMLYWRVDAF